MYRFALLAAVSLAVLSPVAAHAQPGGRPMPQAANPAEVYADFLALKAQVQQLQQQMAQQRAQYEQELTQARFRITALEAGEKQGGASPQLQSEITALTGRTSTLEAHWNQTSSAIAGFELGLNKLSGRLDQLTQTFNTHTHNYGRTLVNYGFVDAQGAYASRINGITYPLTATTPPAPPAQ